MTNIIPISVPDNYDHDHHDEVISDRDNNKYTNYSRNKIICTKISSGLTGRALKGAIFLAAIALGCVVLLSSFSPPFPILLQPSNSKVTNELNQQLDSILRKACTKDGNKTVIITILNNAWAEPNSIFDLFLESFRIGNDTEGLLRHLVVICMDEKAYSRCSDLQLHCYQFPTRGVNFTNEAYFMSPNYVEMVGRKIELLSEVLEMGYSFVFTDNDIMWLRNPFQHFLQEDEFQMSCDEFNGNPYDPQNLPNTGFQYMRSTHRTIQFYKYWYFSIRTFQRLHDQNAFNRIKFDLFIKFIGLRMRFLDTTYFGGFCQPSKDLNLVCTMHANCCKGIKDKINDLTILLEDWKQFKSSQLIFNPHQSPWSVPKTCRI